MGAIGASLACPRAQVYTQQKHPIARLVWKRAYGYHPQDLTVRGAYLEALEVDIKVSSENGELAKLQVLLESKLEVFDDPETKALLGRVMLQCLDLSGLELLKGLLEDPQEPQVRDFIRESLVAFFMGEFGTDFPLDVVSEIKGLARIDECSFWESVLMRLQQRGLEQINQGQVDQFSVRVFIDLAQRCAESGALNRIVPDSTNDGLSQQAMDLIEVQKFRSQKADKYSTQFIYDLIRSGCESSLFELSANTVTDALDSPQAAKVASFASELARCAGQVGVESFGHTRGIRKIEVTGQGSGYRPMQRNYMDMAGNLTPNTVICNPEGGLMLEVNELGAQGDIPDKPLVAFFGDSTMFGINSDSREIKSWPERLKVPGSTVQNFSVEGWPMARMVRRYERLKRNHELTSVVVYAGWHNLIYNERSEAYWRQQLGRFLSVSHHTAFCTLASCLVEEVKERGIGAFLE
ncbi:MAG: hypothetical protein HOK28_15695 [Deltaproteobacteria bacterium]|nr:hypothetical protein [Deltaproteobacteria bacterium]